MPTGMQMGRGGEMRMALVFWCGDVVMDRGLDAAGGMSLLLGEWERTSWGPPPWAASWLSFWLQTSLEGPWRKGWGCQEVMISIYPSLANTTHRDK